MARDKLLHLIASFLLCTVALFVLWLLEVKYFDWYATLGSLLLCFIKDEGLDRLFINYDPGDFKYDFIGVFIAAFGYLLLGNFFLWR